MNNSGPSIGNDNHKKLQENVSSLVKSFGYDPRQDHLYHNNSQYPKEIKWNHTIDNLIIRGRADIHVYDNKLILKIEIKSTPTRMEASQFIVLHDDYKKDKIPCIVVSENETLSSGFYINKPPNIVELALHPKYELEADNWIKNFYLTNFNGINVTENNILPSGDPGIYFTEKDILDSPFWIDCLKEFFENYKKESNYEKEIF